MAGRSVDRQFGPIFAVCGPKYNKLVECACTDMIVVCNAVFPTDDILLGSDVVLAIARKSRCFWAAIFQEGPPNFCLKFVHLSHHRTGSNI